MTGDPVTPFLVENWSKGLLAGHEEEAYAVLRENATSTPPASSPYNGRNGNPLVHEARLHPVRPRAASTRAATTTAGTRPRRRSSTPPPTLRSR